MPSLSRLWLVTSPVEPVRAKPSHESEMVTQALGGMVLSCTVRGDWVRARVPGGITGWIRSWGVRRLEEGSPWLYEPGVVVQAPWAPVRFLHGEQGLVPAGVRFLVLRRGQRSHLLSPWGEEGMADAGKFRDAMPLIQQGVFGHPYEPSEPMARAGIRLTLQRAARRTIDFIGVPYIWGGLSSGGMDCSGLTWISAALEGLLIPRDSGDQCAWFRRRLAGRKPGRREEVRPKQGEILFFGSSLKGVDHVGLGMGNGRFLHASRRVRFSSLIPGADGYEATLRSRLVWIVSGGETV